MALRIVFVASCVGAALLFAGCNAAGDGEGEGEGEGEAEGEGEPECVAGFSGDMDPGRSSAGWTIVGGGVTSEDGEVLSAAFLGGNVCSGSARAFIDIEMPCEPTGLTLAVDARTHFLVGDPFDSIDARDDTHVLFGDRELRSAYFLPSAFEAPRCLGAAAFGDVRRLEVLPRSTGASCDVAAELSSVTMTAEPTCPLPGDVVAFENWTLSTDAFGTSDDVEVIGSALQLGPESPIGCTSFGARGPDHGAVSVPDEGNIALSVQVDGVIEPDTLGSGLFMTGDVPVALNVGENIVCIPTALQGTVLRVGFELVTRNCAEPAQQQVTIAAPTFASDDRCAGGALAAAIAGASTWGATRSEFADARIDDGALVIESSHLCDLPQAFFQLDAPLDAPTLADDAGRSAVFTYSLQAPDDGTAGAFIELPDGFIELVPSGSELVEVRTCISPARTHEVLPVRVGVPQLTGGTCIDEVPEPSTLRLFSARVDSDPECPVSLPPATEPFIDERPPLNETGACFAFTGDVVLGPWRATNGILTGDGQALLASTGEAALAREIEMPCAEEPFAPLALEVELAMFTPESFSDRSAAPPPLVFVGDSLVDLVGDFLAPETRACMGARAFGSTQPLTIKPFADELAYNAGMRSVKRAEVVVEESCPAPGSVIPFESWQRDDEAHSAVIASELLLSTERFVTASPRAAFRSAPRPRPTSKAPRCCLT